MAQTDPNLENESIGALFGRLSSDVGTLVHKEMELAKVEIKEEVQQAAKAGGKFGAAALTGYLFLLFASFALAFLLDEWMHTALAFAIVAVVYGIVAFVMARKGRTDLKQVNPRPEQTIDTLKEDVAWAKAPKS